MSSALTDYFCLRFGRSGSSTAGDALPKSVATGNGATNGAASCASVISVIAGVTIAGDVAVAAGGVSNH